MGASQKLLIVMPSGNPHGGAEEALIHLAKGRQIAHLELSIVFLEKGPLLETFAQLGIFVSLIPAKRIRNVKSFLRSCREIRRLISAQKPDLVLSWMTKAHLYAGIPALLSKVPAAYFQMGLPEGGWIDRLSRLVPAVGALACSEFAAAEQRKCVRYPVLAVPLAADRERFTQVLQVSPSEMKARLGFDSARPLVGIAGRLQRWKGMHIFAQAMVEVARQRPDCQIVIVGGVHQMEPGYEDYLQKLIEEIGLKDRIRMVGFQPQIPQWMQAMDVFVHASEREPFGIVVVEAMTLGKCVIATQPGGPAEIIQDGENGLLVEHGDIAALSASILRFLNDSDLAKECREGARERSQDFTVERFATNVAAAARTLLNSESGVAAKNG